MGWLWLTMSLRFQNILLPMLNNGRIEGLRSHKAVCGGQMILSQWLACAINAGGACVARAKARRRDLLLRMLMAAYRDSHFSHHGTLGMTSERWKINRWESHQKWGFGSNDFSIIVRSFRFKILIFRGSGQNMGKHWVQNASGASNHHAYKRNKKEFGWVISRTSAFKKKHVYPLADLSCHFLKNPGIGNPVSEHSPPKFKIEIDKPKMILSKFGIPLCRWSFSGSMLKFRGVPLSRLNTASQDWDTAWSNFSEFMPRPAALPTQFPNGGEIWWDLFAAFYLFQHFPKVVIKQDSTRKHIPRMVRQCHFFKNST